MNGKMSAGGLTSMFADAIAELQEEPEFQGGNRCRQYACDDEGMAQIKLAVGNVPVDYDMWQDLRNPAVLGLHPAGLPEIWEFHANRRKQKSDETGRQSIFQVPRSFDYALTNYGRAVIISVMLPFSPQVVREYVSRVIDSKKSSSHLFARMYEDANRMLDKAVSRVAIQLASANSEDVVVAMNNENVKNISAESIPQTHQGISHGPSKGGNFPQKSLAVLMGLGQFGVSRLIIRDEIVDGKVQRFAGPIRSIVVFDKQPLVTDGAEGVMYPSTAWREFLMRLFDFTDGDPKINDHRFCGYLAGSGGGCNKCVENCPSGAQPSSTPLQNGAYSDQIARQAHRFWKGKLQFDFNKCQDERGQLAGLYPEWSCARCLNVCLDRGVRRKQSVSSYYAKLDELAKSQAVVAIT